ncbi:specifically androgen-regulated gene protein [Phyllopteryx taeniolatus]|uniref:specifically androgen-regulated gene protein n=1 Tax=Phyllopteryx taeniolatus TaxID=161469 RepID=UPI002AD3A7BF|nr:specifically androgen-regulated gene protein [Phyllopteryx taeniolatus]
MKMPKSDTWPGGTAPETSAGMDGAGSCDSVVSGHSGFSDDSLEHLSAEEKACLMFLEETIESLDTQDDSGRSDDELDLLPDPGSLASRLADLSASMSKTKLNGLQKHNFMETVREKVENKSIQNYLVPTPFVLASSSNCAEPNVNAAIQLNKKKSLSFSDNSSHKPAGVHVPFEVNVVIPAATKPKDNLVKTGERGPLSYDALVYLRRSASTKKTPLCPTVDHTVDLVKCVTEGPNTGNDRAVSEADGSRTGPPPVAAKPKRIPSNISTKTEREAGRPASNSSYSLKNTTDPKVVRQEALQKLGLLKDRPSETAQVARLELPKFHSSAGDGFSKSPADIGPSRSPSFCHAPVPPGPRSKGLQSTASFHHRSGCDRQPVSLAQLNRLKTTGPERPVNCKNEMNRPQPRLKTVAEEQPVAPKASNSVAYTVMMVPGMGADRKEALRKLGLLRDEPHE